MWQLISCLASCVDMCACLCTGSGLQLKQEACMLYESCVQSDSGVGEHHFPGGRQPEIK